MSERKKLFENYFDSIFASSNTFSKKEYEGAADFYESNYGRFLPEDKKAKILDVGCGASHFLYFLKKKGYKNFLGIDISPQQINFCKENISKEVEVADGFEFLKDKENIYEAIIANDLLEHIPKDKTIEILTLVNKALKDRGIFLMRTLNCSNPFSIFLRYKDFTHEMGFTEKSLYQVLWIAGFRNIQIMGAVGRERIVFSILRKAIYLFLRKLFWYQGFVAPKILSSVLIGIAKK